MGWLVRNFHQSDAICIAGGSRLRLQALTVSQIEARVEDPTVALKKLLEEQK